MRAVSRGDRGKEVVDIQTRLRALGFFLGREGADGHFGAKTEMATRAFQQQRLILSDGVVGENTWAELVEAGYEWGERLLYLRVPNMRGDDVLHLQRLLNELGFDSGPENGVFGAATEEALTEFQRNAGLPVDAIVGEATVAHLRRIRKAEQGRQSKKIPDRLDGYAAKHSLRSLRVCLDAAHGGSDLGGAGHGGLLEKDVNLALARELAVMLGAGGAEVLLTRSGDTGLGLYRRAEVSNAWGADVHICLHHGCLPGGKARGAAAFYFANGTYFSEGGKRLAGYLVKALVEKQGRVDLHPHGRNYACLRETSSLSVVVEPGYLSHPEEGAELAGIEGVRREASAIRDGLEWYLKRL
jgi:N-acetylmuramoyl-L-alanine amidase